MHVGNVWVVPARLIVAVYAGPLTHQDVLDGATSAISMMSAACQPPVHIISDVRLRGPMAANLFSLSGLGPISNLFRDDRRLGWMLIVDPAPNQVLRFLGNSLATIGRFKLRVFTTIEEAGLFLNQLDPTLPAPLDFTDLPKPAPVETARASGA